MSDRDRAIALQPFVVIYRTADGVEYRGQYRYFGASAANRHGMRKTRSSKLAGYRVLDERENPWTGLMASDIRQKRHQTSEPIARGSARPRRTREAG